MLLSAKYQHAMSHSVMFTQTTTTVIIIIIIIIIIVIIVNS
jgi:hypothetical protein